MPKNPDPTKNGGRKTGPNPAHDKGKYRICNSCGGSGVGSNGRRCVACGGAGGRALPNI